MEQFDLRGGSAEYVPHPKSESLPRPHSRNDRQQRDRVGASTGSDQHNICRAARKPSLPRASLRAQDPSPTKSTPAERDGSVARVGSDQSLPSRAARKPILPRASLRAQDPSRGAHANHTQQRVPLATYANSPLITSPAMSVSRKSRPSKRCVKRVCSIPKRCSIVACKSCTFTGFSTML